MKFTIVTILLTFSFCLKGEVLITVDQIPSSGVFQNYGVLDWEGVDLNQVDLDQFKSEAIDESLSGLVPMVQDSGSNYIVLFSNGSKERKEFKIEGVTNPLLLDTQSPKLIAIWFKDAKAGSGHAFIPFVSKEPEKPNGSIDFDISLEVNSAGVSLSHWVYLNLPKFMSEAVKIEASSIFIESTSDVDFEEVWLPQLETPIKLSKTNPKLHVEIIK